MTIFTVTVNGNGETKTVTVDTDGMVANVVSPVITPTHASTTPGQHVNSVVHMDSKAKNDFNGEGGKRSAPSFRLKKRRITRKLKKTR